MKKILSVFGTRPEAIKMAPLVLLLQKDPRFDAKVCLTAQHREMLDSVVDLFQFEVHHDLDLMRPNQNLFQMTSMMLNGLSNVLEEEKPDVVMVHGDTCTTLSASIAAYYTKAKLGHVEAGLRTHNKFSPWPEEGNRRVAGVFADYHFAPTKIAADNLIREGVNSENICITGNTVIDALLMARKMISSDKNRIKDFENKFSFINQDSKLLLVTGHRRENFGGGFENICLALKEIAEKFPDVTIVYPVHLNPSVQEPVNRILSGQDNIFLIKPLDYLPFCYLLDHSYIVLTDSGGIQEEAPSFGKPVLVMRDTTERPEVVASGNAKLVGTEKDRIVAEVSELLFNRNAYSMMSKAQNPYGDGKACERILDFLAA